MNPTIVVNKYKSPYDCYIGRGSLFGNPYPISPELSREACLEKYREYFYARIQTDPLFHEAVLRLQGKTLGCFCKPKACHGDIIAAYVDHACGDLAV